MRNILLITCLLAQADAVMLQMQYEVQEMHKFELKPVEVYSPTSLIELGLFEQETAFKPYKCKFNTISTATNAFFYTARSNC